MGTKPSSARHTIFLEFISGLREEATLLWPFAPDRGEVNVILKRTIEMQKFAFAELCAVLMAADRESIERMATDDVVEEITTVAGKRYRCRAVPEGSHEVGFYGILTDEADPHRIAFFIESGVKARQQQRTVGDILQEKGIVTQDSLDETLQHQKMLKERRVGDIIVEEHAVPRPSLEDVVDRFRKDGKTTGRLRVGDILIEAGLVTKEQIEQALSSQEAGKHKRIGELLIERGFITEDQLLLALSTKFQMPLVDLEQEAPHKKALEALPADVARRLQVFPIVDRGDRLIVATSQPTDFSIVDTLRFQTGRRVDMVVAKPRQIRAAIEKHYPRTKQVLENLLEELSLSPPETDEVADEGAISESDSQIVSLVNHILVDAHGKGASDIHIEPGLRDQPVQIRYRVDGLCHRVHEVPNSFKRAILSRVKIMADLDIAERRRPQSGKILMKVSDQRVEYRVEITPTAGGNEDAVLRILSSARPISLDAMLFSPVNLKRMKEILGQPHGLILCVGPTGSGKTTTLHSALAYINTPERKIWTVEDPVEITQDGLRQVQLQPKIGLTFAEVLRSFLRADPDVIMVGEMRDFDAAKIAIEASLTGHLVLSTLHTNSAAETIVRLIEMGEDPLNCADALLGILAQRLTRRLCPACKTATVVSPEELQEIREVYDPLWYDRHQLPASPQGLTLMRARGCAHCGRSGYQGRIALHELLVGTEAIKKAVKKKAPADELKAVALEDGMRTLLMDGIGKVLQGWTDLGQVLKVCAMQTTSDLR